jgi:hypothetical protein
VAHLIVGAMASSGGVGTARGEERPMLVMFVAGILSDAL